MNLERIEERAEQLRLLGLMISRAGETVYTHHWDIPCRRLIFSASKTFTGCAVGFAVEEGLLRLEERLADLFPDEMPEDPGPNLLQATLRDCLTMCLGQEKGYLMGAQRVAMPEDDWARAALAIPFDFAPGTRFVYSNVGPYLAGLAVQKRAGCDLVDYLAPRLFTPLGIKLPTWERDPLGRTFGASGLMLAITELHKLGVLYQQNGCWEGRQVLPAAWAAESSRKQAENGEEGYGYLLWRGKYRSFRADGMYGQYSVVIPEKQAVITTTAEIRDQRAMLAFLLDEIYPQL